MSTPDPGSGQDELAPRTTERRRGLPLPIVLAIAFSVVVASVAGFIILTPGCLLNHTYRSGKSALKDAAQLLSQTFHLRTEILQSGTVQVYEASRSVQEYVVLEEVIYREKNWKITGWFFQQKGVEVQHRVRAKYGFDLRKGTMRISENPLTGELTVRYPQPELLSVEVLQEDWQRQEGWFNKVTDADIKAAQEMLRKTARQELARDGSRLEKARQIFEERVRASLQHRGIEVSRFEAVDETTAADGDVPSDIMDTGFKDIEP